MAKRFLVVGVGRFGAAVATQLSEHGVEVIAVDREMAAIERVKDAVSMAAQLDSTDPRALDSIEASACESALVAIGEDFESAILSVAALKELGLKSIVARARSEREARIFTAVGASETVLIEPEMGKMLAQRLAGRAG